MVHKVQEQYDLFDLSDMSLVDIRDKFQNLIDIYGEDAIVCDDYSGYDNGYEYVISYYRDETEKEKEKRVKAEDRERIAKEKAKVKKLEKELREYERLKKKFKKNMNNR